jgi:two-component sensor histidine kinase
MQMLQALLSVSQRETSDPKARSVLADAMRKVAAMAAAQQLLYEEGRPADFKAGDFIRAVCAATRTTFPKTIAIEIEAAQDALSNDTAMPLALILNELLTNAVKHSVDGSGEGTIRVLFSPSAPGYKLVVEDDGPGFDLVAGKRRSSGLGLVEGLARQIGGSFRVERDGGARCIVQFGKERTSTS